MNTTNDLVIPAIQAGGCSDGLNQLILSGDINDRIKCFLDRIDFCLAKDFPTLDYMRKNQDALMQHSVFVDRKLVRDNPERLVLLGKCDFEVNFSGFSVSRIYAKHDAFLIVTAKDNSFVVIDALDNAKVFVKTHGGARVVVNLYSAAECTGATKIVPKNKETYEL